MRIILTLLTAFYAAPALADDRSEYDRLEAKAMREWDQAKLAYDQDRWDGALPSFRAALSDWRMAARLADNPTNRRIMEGNAAIAKTAISASICMIAIVSNNFNDIREAVALDGEPGENGNVVHGACRSFPHQLAYGNDRLRGGTEPRPSAPSTATQTCTTANCSDDSSWSAHVSRKAQTVCYVLAQPDDQGARAATRIFLTLQKTQNARYELAISMGSELATRDAKGFIQIDGSTFPAIARGQNLWAQGADEDRIVNAMRHGNRITVSAMSSQGQQIEDRYALSGLNAALDRVVAECP